MIEHPTRLETRSVAQGVQSIHHHGDGTCTKSWGPTEDKAVENLQEDLSDD